MIKRRPPRRTPVRRSDRHRETFRHLAHETLERRELLAAEIGYTPIATASYAPGTSPDRINNWTDNGGGPIRSDALRAEPILTDELFRWRNSALGTSPNLGDPITVTWGIVPDGTQLVDPNTGSVTGTSNLIAFMDGIYGNAGTTVVSEKPWFPLFETAYGMWADSTGLNFVYEPNDDRAAWAGIPSVGAAGVRPDMRIAGAAIDGDFGVLAVNYLPTGFGNAGFDGDMLIDTADVYYSLAADSADGPNVALVNILAHEIGHGIGILHSEPVNSTKLMEPFINTNFYGPQEDDLFNANILYGDRLESNDTLLTATQLGTLAPNVPRVVSNVSIDHPVNDVDFYRVEVVGGAAMSVVLRPTGSAYLAGPQDGTPVPVNRASQSDLGFRVYDSTGTVVADVNANPVGQSEFINGLTLVNTGSYYIAVYAQSGADSQSYELSVQVGESLDVGPQILAIRPDSSGLLQDGDILNIAPREFNVFFKGGANLDESTINRNTVRLLRSGGDGTFGDGNEVLVQLGYVGLVNPGSFDPTEQAQMVFRPASSAAHNPTDPAFAFPDDYYQIEIIGTGSAPLSSKTGEALFGGVDYVTNFRLDRGAQVVAVVPQPVTRVGGSLSQATNVIEVYFDDQLLNISDAEDPKYFRLVDTGGTLATDDDKTILPESADYDPASNRVTLTFASAIPEGTYRLDVGLSDGGNVSLASAIRVGTLFNENGFTYNGYLGDINGVNNDSGDVDFYRIELGAGANLSVAVTPHDQTVSFAARVLDAAGVPVAGLAGLTAGTYFIEVSSADGGTGSYVVDATVTNSPVSASDNNTTFSSATPLGTLGAAGLTVAAQIQRQGVAMPPRPGGEDEPGHRQIQREVHLGSTGMTPSLPAPVRTVSYHFPPAFPNSTSPGESFLNQITDEEKRISRTIFDIFASLSGYEFVETTGGGLAIGKTDLRAFDPSAGPNSGIAGLGGGAGAIVNAALYQDADRFYGDGFTTVMFHEIGHAIGLGHSYDLPALMGAGLPEDVIPGDHDIVHLQRLVPPNSTDIDLYRFELDESGKFTAETIAERLATPSLLNSVISLYRETAPGVRELIARNDRYFGNDSFLELDLQPGTYFVGVTSTGNDQYDPNVPDSGFGGTTDGVYQLRLGFVADRGGSLRDSDGTAMDGDGDGTPGGVHQFWFQASDVESTIFVDRANDPRLTLPDGNGSIGNPFDTLSVALAAAGSRIVVPAGAASGIVSGQSFVVDDGVNRVTFSFDIGPNPISLAGLTTPEQIAGAIAGAINSHVSLTSTATAVGRVVRISAIDKLDLSGTPTLLAAPNLVRIVGNGGSDGDLATPANNLPYLVGSDTSGNPLRDGAEFLVPQGVTVMVDAGVLIKLRKANLDAGTSSINVSRAASSIQVLGTPSVPVWLRSFHDDSVGGNSDGVGPSPRAGDFGGIVFRGDSDLEATGIYLNHVSHASIRHGGGKVFVDSDELVFTPIHVENSRPSVRFNHIFNSADAAISANPDSFEDSLGRLGPEIVGNFLRGNTIDGLFIRIRTELGSTLDKLTVPGRFHNTDIAHVLTENLLIAGNPGGPLLTPSGLVARAAGRLVVDPGVVVKLSGTRIEAERGDSAVIAEGTANRPVIFTSLADDRYGGSGSFDTNANGNSVGQRADWAGFYFGHLSSGSFDHALFTFGGGGSPIEGGAENFNVIEVHQADLRITNSILRENAGGSAGGSLRNGRGANQAATIYVRGSQPVVLNNTFVNNAGAIININANSLNYQVLPDYGRATGLADRFDQFADNQGPLIRANRLRNNDTNAMAIRGGELTTEGVWDDTDIVHVLRDEIRVDNHHTFSGLTLQSGSSESLVVKFDGPTAGITATGTPLDIVDRIGGTVHVLGTPGFPVVLTHLADDTVGAGFAPDGAVMTNTNNSPVPTVGSRGGWRGLVFDEWSNDRNVAVIRELETPLTSGQDVNRTASTAQFIGELAPQEKSGDESRRLGFEVHGFISPNDPGDVDVYSFRGTAGTPIWIDVDRTDPTLDLIVEVINSTGTVVARSVRSGDLVAAGNVGVQPLTQNPLLGGDFYTQNFRDPGFYYVLPGTAGSIGTYFVRVRSNPQSGSIASLAGVSTGRYQLQLRLRQVDEFPGSTVRYSDIRFATTAIDVQGLPKRSPLVGEAGELPAGNDSFDSAQQLVNLLETDMAALSISGGLTGALDVDWFRFDVEHAGIQVIAGANDDPGTVGVVFDLDYADGAVRADATVAVYDDAGRLIWIGRESNVADDQPIGPGSNVDDLSRGSLGRRDAYIGPVHVRPSGTYYVAVMSNQQLPSALSGAYLSSPAIASNALVRLEPVNTVRRVVEDHIGFQGHSSNGANVVPETDGIFDISSANALDDHVVPFRLEDVVLYVASDVAGGNDGDHLYTVNPHSGERFLTRVTPDSGLVAGANDVQDIVIRSDGRMFGYQRLENTPGSVGALVEIDPTTGATTLVGNDNIRGETPTPDIAVFANNIPNRVDQFTVSSEVDALAMQRVVRGGFTLGSKPDYDVYYSVRESDGSSKLYRARENGDATPAVVDVPVQYGFLGRIQPAGVTTASTEVPYFNGDGAFVASVQLVSKIAGAGGDFTLTITRNDAPNEVLGVNVGARTATINLDSNPVAGAGTLVDLINTHPQLSQFLTAVITAGGAGTAGTAASPGGGFTGVGTGTALSGRVTGLSFGNLTGGGGFFGVTSAGEFIRIDPNNGNATVLNTIAGVSFQGLSLGPQNVQGGQFANMLFATATNGNIYAFGQNPNDINQWVLQPIFAGNATSINVSGMSGGTRGLAFSPLDFNLWHPTMKRGNDAGHGINSAPDDSRNPGDVNVTVASPGAGADRSTDQGAGGASFHFGFEQWDENPAGDSLTYLTYTGQRAQLGIRSEIQHADLSSNQAIVNSYNFPGGALGSLVSAPFSLAGSVAQDRPTLYFNYFLDTENNAGSNVTSDVDDPFRDSARVFASRDGGVTWELVATNNSRLSGADPTAGSERAELPGFLSHLSEASRNSATPRPQTQQIVQELMDSSGQWRQARIDLSTFAGVADIRLRVDFSTAGAMDDTSLGVIDANFGEFRGAERSIRSTNNRFEGFYIDDIIVGYAERGEMVTGVVAPDTSVTDLGAGGARTRDNDPGRFPNVLSGNYQLEIRRVDDVAQLVPDVGIAVLNTFGTNDRHVNDLRITGTLGFEPGEAFSTAVPTDLVIPGVLGGQAIPAFAIAPWGATTIDPLTGARSLGSATNYGTLPPGLPVSRQPLSVFETTVNQLTGSSIGGGGLLEFTYSVSSSEGVHGLLLFIDGQPQLVVPPTPPIEGEPGSPGNVLASGELRNVTVRFALPSATSKLTWVYLYLDDQNNPAGANRAWIDDIKVLQGGTGFEADRNRHRPQGVFIVESNTITDSSVRGINVQPGQAQAGGSVPHPGSTINFPQLNQDRLVPGVVIQNNIIAGSSAIRFAGETSTDPQRPVPFGRIVNNTLVGVGGGVGIEVVGNASPTVMNNIITRFATGIGGATGATVVRSNYFQGNTANGPTGTDAIIRAAATPLFVNPAAGNYYLVSGSAAVDSALDTLQDRFNFVNFKNELGLSPSPIFSPDRDVYGQLRVDSGQSPGGGGSAVFKDRGAVDRADFDAPFAVLLDPIDNDNAGIDQDPNQSVVSLTDPIIDAFSILLADGRGPNSPPEGTGVNPATVSPSVVTVRRNNQSLVEGVDYKLGYNASTSEMRLTPMSTLWEPSGVYEIILDNRVIADLAGNLLRPNQADGTTRFWIILPSVGLDFGDAPDSFGTLLASDGARHALIDGATPRLGRYVDSEPDGNLSPSRDDSPADLTITSPSDSAIFVINDSGTPSASVQIDESITPRDGDTLRVDIGGTHRTFELVGIGVAPAAGNVAVRFLPGESATDIAAKLAAAMGNRLGAPGDALAVSVDDLSPDTILIANLDDEDGVGIATLELDGTPYIVFVRPDDTSNPAYPESIADRDEVLGFLNPLDPAGAQIAITVTGNGFLDAWIDFDGNGVFDPESEKIFDSVTVVDGLNVLNIVTPAGTAPGTRWARFRISPEGGLQPTGLAVGGEVEDYPVQIIPVALPQPAADYYEVDENLRYDAATGVFDVVTLDSLADGFDPVLANDTVFEPQLAPVRVILVNSPSHAASFTLDRQTGHFTYVPQTDFSGSDTFTYYLATQQSAEDVMPPGATLGTVTIKVRPMNDPPLAQDQSFTTVEDMAITITAADLLRDAAAHFDPQYPPASVPGGGTFVPDPYNEGDQELRVISITVDGTVVSAANAGDGPFTTDNGSFEAYFDGDGSLIEVVYTPGLDLNRDNRLDAFDPASPGPFERFEFTIEDDGIVIDPDTGDSIPRAPLTHTATAAINVTPQNDSPTPFDDLVTVGPIGAGVILPIPTPYSAWVDYHVSVLGLDLTAVPVPTEGQQLRIPGGFLTRNDLPGTSRALDENTGVNDGALKVISVSLVDDSQGTVSIVDGDIVFVPAENLYGEIEFTYEVQDSGVDEDVDGVREDGPDNWLTSVGMFTVVLQPVNDAPAAEDKRFDLFDESPAAGRSGVYTIFANQLLTGAIPGAATSLPEPFNEAEQSLRVVRLGLDWFGAGVEYVDVNDLSGAVVPGTGVLTLAAQDDQDWQFFFHFEDYGLTRIEFFTAPDYNLSSPFDAERLLRFVVEDDGRTTDPQTGEVVYLEPRRSEESFLTIVVSPTNDAPVFDFNPVVNVLERDDSGQTVVTGWASNILPGPSTASDELIRQGVSFEFIAGGSIVPAGLFLSDPVVNANGTLTLFPAPDAVGQAIIVMRANDFLLPGVDDDPGFVSRFTQVPITVNVQPVNDAPRLNGNVTGTGQSSDDDTAWAIDGNGVITYTLREDNTQAGGDTSVDYFIPLRSLNLPVYSQIGLLDAFVVGPANEADGTPGGSQTLSLDPDLLPTSTNLGGQLTPVRNGAGEIIGLNYRPPLDLNLRTRGVDGFTYRVLDDGQTYRPGASPFESGALEDDFLGATGTVVLRLNPVNDPPQFETVTSEVNVLEDGGASQLANFAINISAGPPNSAFDELAPVTGQRVNFTVTPVSPADAGLFSVAPQVSESGRLTFTPAPNAFGTAYFDIQAFDNGPQDASRGDVWFSQTERLTIHIRPVNDPPVLNTTTPIAFTLNEDGAVPQSDGTVAFAGTFIPLRGDGASVGLLDVFNAGPANEMGPTSPGGNQTVRLTAPLPTSTAQGGTLARVFDPNDATKLIGLRYMPRANFNGQDSFVYGVIDDGVTSDLQGNVTSDPREAFTTVTLTVAPLNDPPQFSGPLSVTVLEDATTTPTVGLTTLPNFVTDIAAGPSGAFDELGQIPGVPGQSVEFVVTPQAGNPPNLFTMMPTVSPAGTLSFRTAPDANGVAVFTIFADDKGPNNPPLESSISSPPRQFTITVTPVNDAPTFVPQLTAVTVAEDSGPFTTAQPFAASISPGPADEVAAEQTVRFEVTVPQAGQALFQTLPNVTDTGFLRFTPKENAVGTTVVSVVAIDSEGAVSTPALVTITITEVNDVPVAGNVSFDGNEDNVLPITQQSLVAVAIDPDLATNPDEVLAVTQMQTTSQRGATIRVTSSGDFEYDPRGSAQLQALRPGQTMIDTFTYRIIDKDQAVSLNLGTVTVRVAGVNDSPTVVDDSATLNVTGSTTIRPLDNDFDVDGTINPLSLQLTLQPAFGSVVVQNDGSLIYTPFEGSRGADFIRYTVADDLGARSAEATITIDTNQAPIALNDNAGTLRQQSVDINVVANDSDPDGSLDLGSIVIVKSPARGTATPIGGGLVRYEPASDFVGVDSFEYTIRDNQGRTSNVALVRVQVVASQLQNPNRFPDVNASGEVSPLDALLIINRLSRSIREGTGTSIPVADLLDETPRYYYDVDGSQLVQPLDALLVINAIAAQNRLRTVGEGESIMAAPPIVAASFTDTPPAVTLTESQPVTILPDEKVAAFDWVDDDIEGIAADVVETRTGNRQEASDLELIDAVWGDFR